MMDKYGLYIDGKWINTEDTLEVLDKYSQKPFAKVSKASENDVDLAISSALEAFETKNLSPYDRYKILQKSSELLLANKEDLAKTIVLEAGKPLKQARSEIDRSAQTFLIAAEEAKRIHGEGVPVEAAPGSENRLAFTIKVPVGVVGAISPL